MTSKIVPVQTIKNGRFKFTLPMLGAFLAILLFAYGIITSYISKPASSVMSEENRLKVVKLETCMEGVLKQLDRIENKVDELGRNKYGSRKEGN